MSILSKKFLFSFSLCLLTICIATTEAQNPRYQNYDAPYPLLGGDAAEPSIGVNWNTGKVLYQSGLETIQVNFNDSTSPASTTWINKPSLLTSLFSLDPVLFTDKKTGRTFVSQLDGGCSLTQYTNDDGQNWTLSIGCGIPAGLDHQSIGGGPYALLPPVVHSSYPNAIFYCSQNLVSAICSRSDDGGFLFGLGMPVYLLTQCGGRHGRIKVAPDGTIYLPNSACNGQQGIAVSENNGITWSIRKIPGSTVGGSDPSIGIGALGTIYFGYQNGDGHPRVAVSKDKGKTWIYDRDVGTAFGIRNTVFPAVVAGDNNRAAFAFLGTPTGGNFEDQNFAGTWHLYIATTFDGGNTWKTVDATPTDPVQVGSINIQDGVQPSSRRITSNMSTPLLDRGDRNLLDFIDAAVDKQGRVLVAYADGCVGDCVSSPRSELSRSALARIARQSGGKRLFSSYDPIEPGKPKAPYLNSAVRSGSIVNLGWATPDNSGSAITKYKIYRRTASTTLTLLKTVGVTNSYSDPTATVGVTYYYRVSAVNAYGEGSKSNEISR